MSTNIPGLPKQIGLALPRLRAFPERIVARLNQYVQERIRISAAPRVSSGATADDQYAASQKTGQELETAKQNALTDFANFRNEATSLVDSALNEISQQLDPTATTDGTQALLHQGAQRDAWARMRGILAHYEPVALHDGVRELAKRALARSDDDSLSALRKELPDYVSARVGNQKELANQELANQVAMLCLSTLDDCIGEARPAAAPILQLKRELTVGMPRLLVGFSQAEYMVKTGELSTIIPAWNPQQADHKVQASPVDQR